MRGEIMAIPRLYRVFEVTVPYARTGPVDELEVLFEVNPYAVLSHLSALSFHGLTDEQPIGFTAMRSTDKTGDLLPLDTRPEDWEGVWMPATRITNKLLGREVSWTRMAPHRFFGFQTYRPLGYPIRVTTPERTLVDAMQEPTQCGGIANSLRAWAKGRETIDVDRVVETVDRLDIGVVRQRVGYVLDQLGLNHPALDDWRSKAHRGGSSKLVGSAPYDPTYDERWNLSLNGPVWALTGDLG